MLLSRLIRPLVRPTFYIYARATRGMTLGVRGLVTDDEGRVLLLEHTYMPGWHMPGGGVERGEDAAEALAREMVEEAGVELTAPPRLVSVHVNRGRFRGDHVLFYQVERWRACKATSRGEIRRVGWFAPHDLPDGTTISTRQRIAEALAGAAADPCW
jgi:ADP-ribose pyrophosphatase YjhB (NUDIX family)